jgi:hypothetical protein
MELSSIANLATSLSMAATVQEVGTALYRKALDIERANAAALLQALPPPPSVNLPPHLGRNIDTTA